MSVLVNWVMGAGQPKILAEFSCAPIFADIDWEHQIFYASLMNGKLIKYDIKASKISALALKTKESVGLSVSPRNTLISWGTADSQIKENALGGNEVTLTQFGRFPAFSSNGSKMAFTRMSNELWLLSKDNKPEMIISFAKTKSYLYDIPTWCPCNHHLAINLVTSGDADSLKRVLLIVDLARKEIALHESKGASTSEGRIWIPRCIIGTGNESSL